MIELQICGSCEIGHMHYDTRDLRVVRPGGDAVVPAVQGYFCDTCDEVYFDENTDSAIRYAAAGDDLIYAARSKMSAKLKRIRIKLSLTAAQAARIAGSDETVFVQYENGTAQPTSAVTNLFDLLDRHPEMLSELDLEG